MEDFAKAIFLMFEKTHQESNTQNTKKMKESSNNVKEVAPT